MIVNRKDVNDFESVIPLNVETEVEKYILEAINCSCGYIVQSGTQAFLAALLSCNIGRKHEVILPISICPSIINVIMLLGATPVLVDVNEQLGLSSEDTIRNITKFTKAILIYHPFGMKYDYDWLKRYLIDNKMKIYIIEDYAQSFGVMKNGVMNYINSDIVIFSFGKNKPISVGIGGFIASNNNQISRRLKYICRTGTEKVAEHEAFGFNMSLSKMDLVMIYEKLLNFDISLENRRVKAKVYMYLLNDVGEFINCNNSDYSNVYHRLILKLPLEFEKIYEKFVGKIQNVLIEYGIKTIQSTYEYPLNELDFVNDYYKSINRLDLYNMNLEIKKNWNNLKKRYLFLKMHEGISIRDIIITCCIIKEIIKIYK